MTNRSKVIFFGLCFLGALSIRVGAQETAPTTSHSTRHHESEGGLRQEIQSLRHQEAQLRYQALHIQEQIRALHKKIVIDEKRLHHHD
jgi:hypothetical protein